MNNKHLEEVKNVKYINLFFTLFSLSIWSLIIKNILLNNKDIEKIPKLVMYFVYSIPYLIIVNDIVNTIQFPNILNYPPTFGYCFHKDENETSVGKIDLDCFLFQNKLVKTLSLQLMNRFYYINYTILLLSLIIEPLKFVVGKSGYSKYIPGLNLFKKNKILLKILSITSMFSLIGYLAPVFSNNTTISIFFYKFITAFLNINVSLLIIVFLVLVYNI